MAEQIYDISELPLSKPSIIYNALKYVNQQALLNLLNQSSPYSRSGLLPVVDLACKHGLIRTYKANVPTKGLLTFVDLESFPQEFDDFVAKVKNHEIEIGQTDVANLLQRNQVKENTFKQKVLRFVTSNKVLLAFYLKANIKGLPLLEKFCSTPEQFARLAAKSLFRPSQIREEICSLLNLLDQHKPQHLLEVGTNRGGTLYLFARVASHEAKLLSMDLHLQHPELLSSFARQKQQVELIEGDSTKSNTVEQVKRIFPTGIDFLFLDGDHSYTGIKSDFENYAPMVKPGGLIAFHDIVEDNETRYGVVTGGWAGGVPRFWQKIKQDYENVEFVKDYAQDGLGIGVLFVPEHPQARSGQRVGTDDDQ